MLKKEKAKKKIQKKKEKLIHIDNHDLKIFICYFILAN